LLGFNAIPKKNYQVEAAKKEEPKQEIKIDTNNFFVPLINFKFQFKPSGQKENIEFYSHKDKWNYVLLNPYTNTLKWQLWGELKSAKYFDSNCQKHSIESEEYKLKKCESFIFNHSIDPKNSIRISYKTTATRNGNEIKKNRVREALKNGNITF